MVRKMTETDLLEKIKTSYQSILQEKLVGIYVHGSIAFGCFTWENSDIDFLVVVRAQLSQREKEALIAELLILDEYAPGKGFEMSVVLQNVCKPFVYPTPYELHYSNSYRDRYREDMLGLCAALHGEDKDLAAHMTVINAVGIPLWGPAVEQVFDPVPKADYLDSILYDVADAESEISENPVYFILNLCRVLAYVQEELVLSKKQGGEWGLEHLPEEYRGLLDRAMKSYGANTDVIQGIDGENQEHNGMLGWDVAELKNFACEILEIIGNKMHK